MVDSYGQRLRFGYDTLSRLITLSDANRVLVRYAWSSDGNLVAVEFTASAEPNAAPPKRLYHYEDVRFPHALTGITDENGVRYATWTYDAQGRAISSEHAGGVDKVTLTYNADGTTRVDDYQDSPTSPTTSRTYGFQTVLGVVKNTSVTQPCASCSGTVASRTYDANGNTASERDFNGSLTCYAYDLARNLETVRVEGLPGSVSSCPADLAAYQPSTATGRVERKVSTAWHTAYRLPVRIAEPKQLTTYAYSDDPGVTCGNPGQLCSVVEQATTDATGGAGLSAATTGPERRWTYTYTTTADITVVGLLKTVDGPRTDVSDVTTYTYYTADAENGDYRRGDLRTLTDALGHVTDVLQYDAAGRPTRVKDLNGVIGSYAYDLRGRLLTQTVAGHTTTFQYDPVGQLVQLTLADGTFVRYTYDDAHRLTDITNPAGERVHYTLDLKGHRTRTAILNANGTVAQTEARRFDSLGRLQQVIGAQHQTTTYGYDTQGLLASVIDPKQQSTQYAYDALQRLREIQNAALGVVKLDYDRQDQLASVMDPNQATTVYAVSGLGALTQEISPDRGTRTATHLAAGLPATRTDGNGTTATYAYDALNRLIGVTFATAGNDLAFTYDAYPGCTNGVGRVCRVQDPAGESRFAYEARGLVTDEWRLEAGQTFITHYAYNPAGRLLAMTTPTLQTFSYARDGVGRIGTVITLLNGANVNVLGNVMYSGRGDVLGQTFGNGYAETFQFDQDGQRLDEPLGTPVAPPFDAVRPAITCLIIDC